MGTDKIKPLSLSSQPKLALTARNTLFALQNPWSTKKILKTGRVPYLGLELTMHVIEKPNPSRETVPLSVVLICPSRETIPLSVALICPSR